MAIKADVSFYENYHRSHNHHAITILYTYT